MRGQRSDYDHWAALGLRGWSWDDVLPIFKRSEDYVHGADEFHGAGGELRVEERRVSWEILDAWRDAAEECGIPKIAEFNRGDNFGSAYFQMNQRRGVRWSATKAFLRPVLSRPNLTVITDALVQRLRIDVKALRATGVVARGGAASTTLRARREVLLAAGSIGSPQILQLSGSGRRAAGCAHGVEVARTWWESARTCTITCRSARSSR
jgi:choline dehydrogenase